MVSDRIVSSVITPPALRITWASPTSRPSRPNSGMRESMQATTATARAGRTGLLPGNRRAQSSFAWSIWSISATHTSVVRPLRPGATLTDGPPAPIGQDVPVRTVEEHRAVVIELLSPLPEEEIALADAHGRVLARDGPAPVALPGFDNSAMDGYAARWAEVSTAAESPVRLPVADDIPAGRTDVVPLAPGTVQRIMTGAPLPAGAAVGELHGDHDVGSGGQGGAGHDPLHRPRRERSPMSTTTSASPFG